ncbi:MAG: hypothetical protein AABZ60_10520 [Planctomycetota bacterium]
MKKSSYFGIFFCLGMSFFATIQAQSLVHLLPEETILFCSLADAKNIEPQALKTIWGQFCQLPQMQETVQNWKAESLPLFNFLDGLAKKNVGISLSELLKLLQGEVSFALIQDTKPHWIGSCFYGTQKELLLNVFYRFLGKATIQNLGAFSVSVYQNGFIYAYFGADRLIVSDSSSELEKILNQLSNPCKAFSQSACYQKHYSGNEYCSVWVNVSQVIRFTNPEAISIELEALGINKIEALSLNYGYEGEYLQWRGKLSFNATPSGIFACTPDQELKETSIRHLRGQISSVAVVAFSAKNWFQSVQNIFKVLYSNESPLEENFNHELWQEFGFTIEELVSIFGNTLSAWDFNNNGTSWSLMAVELEAPEIFEKLFLPRMARFFSLQIRTKEYRGVTIYQVSPILDPYLRNEAQMLQGLSFLGVPTHFIIHQKHLILASLPHALQAYLDMAPSFSGKGPFVHLDQNIKGKILSILSYDPILSASSYRNILHFLKRFETIIRTFGIPLSFGDFPRATEILPLIRPNSFEVYWKENLLTMDLKIGFPLTLDKTNFAITSVAGVGIVAAIAIPGLLRARTSSNETSAIGILRTISTSQNQFQNACMKDRDVDGTGEYGFFTELAGTLPVPVGNQEGSPARPAFINSVLGTTSMQNGGIAQKSGYYFLMYLPSGSENGPIRENGQVVPPASYVQFQEMSETEAREINAQETRWCAYAWPVSAGESGNKAFFINQAGEVFATSNISMGSSTLYYSGLERVPDVGDIFAQDGTGDLDGSIMSGLLESTRNGLMWNPND